MEPAGRFEPTPRQDQLIDRLAAKVVERQMVVPAVLFLETVKPLGYISSQVLVFFGPIAKTIFSPQDYDEVARFLEHRQGIEVLLSRIEAKADERDQGRPSDADSEPSDTTPGDGPTAVRED